MLILANCNSHAPVKQQVHSQGNPFQVLGGTSMFCKGGGFLSVKDAFSETGYPAFYR